MMVPARIIVDYVPVPEVGIIWVSWDGTGRRGHRASVGTVGSLGCEPGLEKPPAFRTTCRANMALWRRRPMGRGSKETQGTVSACERT